MKFFLKISIFLLTCFTPASFFPATEAENQQIVTSSIAKLDEQLAPIYLGEELTTEVTNGLRAELNKLLAALEQITDTSFKTKKQAFVDAHIADVAWIERTIAYKPIEEYLFKFANNFDYKFNLVNAKETITTNDIKPLQEMFSTFQEKFATAQEKYSDFFWDGDLENLQRIKSETTKKIQTLTNKINAEEKAKLDEKAAAEEAARLAEEQRLAKEAAAKAAEIAAAKTSYELAEKTYSNKLNSATTGQIAAMRTELSKLKDLLNTIDEEVYRDGKRKTAIASFDKLIADLQQKLDVEIQTKKETVAAQLAADKEAARITKEKSLAAAKESYELAASDLTTQLSVAKTSQISEIEKNIASLKLKLQAVEDENYKENKEEEMLGFEADLAQLQDDLLEEKKLAAETEAARLAEKEQARIAAEEEAAQLAAKANELNQEAQNKIATLEAAKQAYQKAAKTFLDKLNNAKAEARAIEELEAELVQVRALLEPISEQIYKNAKSAEIKEFVTKISQLKSNLNDAIAAKEAERAQLASKAAQAKLEEEQKKQNLATAKASYESTASDFESKIISAQINQSQIKSFEEKLSDIKSKLAAVQEETYRNSKATQITDFTKKIQTMKTKLAELEKSALEKSAAEEKAKKQAEEAEKQRLAKEEAKKQAEAEAAKKAEEERATAQKPAAKKPETESVQAAAKTTTEQNPIPTRQDLAADFRNHQSSPTKKSVSFSKSSMGIKGSSKGVF